VLPKSLQRCCSSSCTQGWPAGFPWGMPGIGLLIEGAVQQAAQCVRQSTGCMLAKFGVPVLVGARL
jgi:hypothetical protein